MKPSLRSLPLVLPGFLFLAARLVQAQTEASTLARLQRDLGIPSTIARVVDGNCPAGQSVPEYILIQDVHRHPEAQGHISALLMYGARHWGLKEVFLEGAQAHQYVIRPAQQSPQDLRNALQEGRIGGAEMAAAMMPGTDMTLIGIEQPELYKSNVQIYEEVDRLRAGAMRELSMTRLLQEGLDVSRETPAEDRFDIAEKLLQLRLKPSEYAAYLEHPVSARPDSTLTQALHTAELFYVLADERSRVYTEVLTADAESEPRAAVIGGFHTARMAEELRKQGHSFVVLSPHITMGGFDELYAKGMQQTISALKIDSPL